MVFFFFHSYATSTQHTYTHTNKDHLLLKGGKITRPAPAPAVPQVAMMRARVYVYAFYYFSAAMRVLECMYLAPMRRLAVNSALCNARVFDVRVRRLRWCCSGDSHGSAAALDVKTFSTVKAIMGDKSRVPPNGGIIPRKRFRYGSVTEL